MERKVRIRGYQKNKKIPLSAENTWTMFFLFLGLKLDLSITIIIFRKTGHVVYGWPLHLDTNDLIFGRHSRRYILMYIWEKKIFKAIHSWITIYFSLFSILYMIWLLKHCIFVCIFISKAIRFQVDSLSLDKT